MSKLSIDGREYGALPGESLLDLMTRQGIAPPTLCRLAGAEPASSCMLCLVECEGRLLPACARRAEDGLSVVARGERVEAARRESLALLAGEHAGDCEAPCSIGCPAGLDVERLHLLGATGRAAEARALVAAAMADTWFCLRECRAYCELACRRRVLDRPLGTRALIATLDLPAGRPAGDKPERARDGRWRSATRALRKEEADSLLRGADDMRAFLRAEPAPPAAAEPALAVSAIAQDTSERRGASRADAAFAPSGDCLLCGCARKDDCALRSVADAMKTAPERRGRRLAAEREVVVLDADSLLVVERGKCLKCGICLRLSAHGAFPLGYEGRGFSARVEGFKLYAKMPGYRAAMESIAPKCPTGALYIIRRGAAAAKAGDE